MTTVLTTHAAMVDRVKMVSTVTPVTAWLDLLEITVKQVHCCCCWSNCCCFAVVVVAATFCSNYETHVNNWWLGWLVEEMLTKALQKARFDIFLCIFLKLYIKPFFNRLISMKSSFLYLSLIYYLLYVDIDDCVNHTCSNGGSCQDGVNSYSCNCLVGFTGDYCHTGRMFFLLFLLLLLLLSGNWCPISKTNDQNVPQMSRVAGLIRLKTPIKGW